MRVVQKEYNAPLAGYRRINGIMARCFESGFAYPASQEPSLYWREAEAQSAAKHFSARLKADGTTGFQLVEQIPVFIPLSIILKGS
jgi:hypothetical protein